jgi:hypothetical protein
MIVADMQNLLKAAKQFAEAAEISSTARSKLHSVCEALEPFGTMEISAFAVLIGQAEEYRKTGVLPVRTKSPKASAKKAKPTAEESAKVVEQLVKQLQDLYAIVHEETVGFGAIDEITEVVGKLSAPDVKQVAAKFGIKVSSRTTRPQALEEIKRKLTEQKGSAQRIQPIGST